MGGEGRRGAATQQRGPARSARRRPFPDPPPLLPRGLRQPQGDGSQITVEPGLILGEVNRLLAAHARKGKHPIQYKVRGAPPPARARGGGLGGGAQGAREEGHRGRRQQQMQGAGAGG
jgi:hypothetical protein